MGVRPADFPPPVSERDFVTGSDRPGGRTDRRRPPRRRRRARPGSSRRFARASSSRTIPALAERLGDVPIAVVEKGKACGSHVLSGAVVNPRSLRLLFPGMRADDMPFYGPVDHEAVYYLTLEAGGADPAAADDAEPRELHRVDEPDLPLARRASGRAGRDDRPRDRRRRSSSSAAAEWSVCARATAGVARTAQELGELRARVGHRRAGDDPRRGHARSPDPRGDLGVRHRGRGSADLRARRQGSVGGPEAAAQDHPHDGLAAPRRVGDIASSAAASSTRWARRWSALGLVVGLDYTDASLSVHDLLQELKLHPLVTEDHRGRDARFLGREDDPRGWDPVDACEVLRSRSALRRRRRRPRERARR